MIIAGFAGVGKTYFCNHIEGARDFVCMPYKYLLLDTGDELIEYEKVKADLSLEMNPEYPSNYVEAILENMDKYKYLVVPSDRNVLAWLEFKDVPYILCYPELEAKAEYLRRYEQRGNTEDFIDIFIGYWENFMESMRYDTHGTHIVLTGKEYLSDVKGLIDDIIRSLDANLKE